MYSIRRWRPVFFLLAPLVPGQTVAAPDFDALEQSVVRIVTQTDQGVGVGTGFAVNDQGHIATNVHVIAGAHSIKAIPTNSNELYDVEVIAASREFDLAIAYIPDLSLPPIALSLAPPIKGQKVWAIGYPGGPTGTDRPTIRRCRTASSGEFFGVRGTRRNSGLFSTMRRPTRATAAVPCWLLLFQGKG